MEKKEAAKQKPPLLPPCPATCKLRCGETFTDSSRTVIHEEFWGLTYNKQQIWLCGFVVKDVVSRSKYIIYCTASCSLHPKGPRASHCDICFQDAHTCLQTQYTVILRKLYVAKETCMTLWIWYKS